MSRDYIEELRKQINYIKISCKEYDAGNHQEAIRIATSLRILFYKSKGIKPVLEKTPVDSLLSTSSRYNEKNLIGFVGLAYMKLGGNPPMAGYEPMLSASQNQKLIPVDEWWGKEVVYCYKPGEVMVRKRLILIAANKDGGAHVDEKLPPEYEKMIDVGVAGLVAGVGGKQMNFENAHLASLRQMGHEILNSPQIISLQQNKNG